MDYTKGDTIVSGGITYTFNGQSWTYEVKKFPTNVTSVHTYVGTPVADVAPITRVPDLQDTYDWEVLSRLAMGAIYANEVQVSY